MCLIFNIIRIIFYIDGINFLSLFSRIKNIVRSNLNCKNSNYSNDFVFEDNSAFENTYSEPKESYAQPEDPAVQKEREYYANLEVAYGANFDDIKASYKRLLKKYHPDKFYGDEKKLQIAQDVVKKLNVAYNYFEEKYNK